MIEINTPKKPALIESGVKYFHNNVLKKCHEKKTWLENIALNTVFFIIFVGIIGAILYYKKKTRPTELDKRIKEYTEAEFILSKIKNIEKQKRIDDGRLITNLPPLNNDIITNTNFGGVSSSIGNDSGSTFNPPFVPLFININNIGSHPQTHPQTHPTQTNSYLMPNEMFPTNHGQGTKVFM